MPNQDSQNSKDFFPKKVVRTYSSDLAQSVKEKGGEAYRIARIEETIKEKEFRAEKGRKKVSLLFGLGGLTLIFLSLIALIYFSSKSNVKLNPEPAPTLRPIIFFDNQKRIEVTGFDKDKILSMFGQEVESQISSGDVLNIIFTENNQPINLGKLLTLLKINLPEGVAPFLNQDYFAGIFANSGENWPFLILRTNSYADISPGVIRWETSIIDDLGILLGVNTTGDNSYLLQAKFTDLIVSNKETRAIKDKGGNPALLYVFLDEKNILFALNKNTLEEVLIRLYSPKK